MSNITRVETLISQIKAFFRLNKTGDIVGVRISKSDVDATVYPNHLIEGVGVKKIVVSETAPSSPEVGDIWIDIG